MFLFTWTNPWGIVSICTEILKKKPLREGLIVAFGWLSRRIWALERVISLRIVRMFCEVGEEEGDKEGDKEGGREGEEVCKPWQSQSVIVYFPPF